MRLWPGHLHLAQNVAEMLHSGSYVVVTARETRKGLGHRVERIVNTGDPEVLAFAWNEEAKGYRATAFTTLGHGVLAAWEGDAGQWWCSVRFGDGLIDKRGPFVDAAGAMTVAEAWARSLLAEHRLQAAIERSVKP